jgi:hypothetical protein
LCSLASNPLTIKKGVFMADEEMDDDEGLLEEEEGEEEEVEEPEEKDEFTQEMEKIAEIVSDLRGHLKEYPEHRQQVETIFAHYQMGKRPFKVTIGLEDKGEYPTFTEAFKVFFAEIKAMVQKGTSLYVLQETNFITHMVPTIMGPMECTLDLYRVGALAYQVGLLVGNDELVEPAQSPDPMFIDLCFLVGEGQNFAYLADMEREMTAAGLLRRLNQEE